MILPFGDVMCRATASQQETTGCENAWELKLSIHIEDCEPITICNRHAFVKSILTKTHLKLSCQAGAMGAA
jgi:hypothetical protein